MALAKNQKEIRCWNQEVAGANSGQVSRRHLVLMAPCRGERQGEGRWVLGEVGFGESRREPQLNEIRGRRGPT